MALTKPAKAAAPAAPGKFEDETPAPAAQTVAEKAPEQSSEQAQAAAGVAASTAVAKVSANAAALTRAIKTENPITKLRDVIPPVKFGTFPRLIGANGNVCNKSDNSKPLGEYADLQLFSWSKVYVVSPGSDAEEAKKFVRYSRDGDTIDETGESVNDYLKQLREVEGYDKAAKKEYIELIGFLLGSQKPGGPVGELVQVSLSPQSLRTFEAYSANVAVRVALNQQSPEGVEMIRITAEPKSGNGKNWTILKVSATPKQ